MYETTTLVVMFWFQLVELPAKLTVVQILENYAKYFALYIAKLPSSEKTMKSGTQTTDFIPPEKKYAGYIIIFREPNVFIFYNFFCFRS